MSGAEGYRTRNRNNRLPPVLPIRNRRRAAPNLNVHDEPGQDSRFELVNHNNEALLQPPVQHFYQPLNEHLSPRHADPGRILATSSDLSGNNGFPYVIPTQPIDSGNLHLADLSRNDLHPSFSQNVPQQNFHQVNVNYRSFSQCNIPNATNVSGQDPHLAPQGESNDSFNLLVGEIRGLRVGLDSRLNMVGEQVSDIGQRVDSVVDDLSSFRGQLTSFKDDIPSLVRAEVQRHVRSGTDIHSQVPNQQFTYQQRSRSPSMGSNSSRMSNHDSKVNKVYSNYAHHKSLPFKELPKFNGKLSPMHPKEFLTTVKSYYCMNRPIPDEFKFNDMFRLLTDDARYWFNIHRYSFSDFDDFCEQFMEEYWSVQDQQDLLHSLNSPGRTLPTEGNFYGYFINLASKAMYLDNPPSETELCSTILSHYPSSVRASLLSADRSSFLKVHKALKELDRYHTEEKANPRRRYSEVHQDKLAQPKILSNPHQGNRNNLFKNNANVRQATLNDDKSDSEVSLSGQHDVQEHVSLN